MRAYGYGFPRMSTLGNWVNRADGRGWGRPPMEGATGPWDGCCLKPGPSLSTRATPPRRRYLRSPGSLAPLVAGPIQGVADRGLAVSEKNSSRKLAEQAKLRLPTARYRISMRVYGYGFPRMSLVGNPVNRGELPLDILVVCGHYSTC